MEFKLARAAKAFENHRPARMHVLKPGCAKVSTKDMRVGLTHNKEWPEHFSKLFVAS